jgi:hypothetical protein
MSEPIHIAEDWDTAGVQVAEERHVPGLAEEEDDLGPLSVMRGVAEKPVTAEEAGIAVAVHQAATTLPAASTA